MNSGDPNDRSLRKVEKEVLIPKLMRERAKAEKCVPEVAAFTSCCKASTLTMAYHCRKENDELRECLTQWYRDPEFQKECKEAYLEERSLFRRTGLTRKKRALLAERGPPDS